MDKHLFGLAAIGACLILVAWQEYRRQNQRDGRLMAGAGTLILVGSAAAAALA